MRTTLVLRAMVAATLWMALLNWPAWSADEIFRCGNNTAVRGDTTVRVLSLCGKPDVKLPAQGAGLPGKDRTKHDCAP
jgi:hypothetical protein